MTSRALQPPGDRRFRQAVRAEGGHDLGRIEQRQHLGQDFRLVLDGEPMAGPGEEAAGRLRPFTGRAFRQMLQQGVHHPATAEAAATGVGRAMRGGGRGFLLARQGGRG